MTKLFKEIRAFVKSGHTKPLIRRERERQREGEREREISIKKPNKRKRNKLLESRFRVGIKDSGDIRL